MFRIGALALTLLTVLAGCADSGAVDACDDCEKFDDVVVGSDVGLIRGIVVDEAIAAVEGAEVQLLGEAGLTATTDANGAFQFVDVTPGDHFLRVNVPNYLPAQVATTVVAGVAEPEIVKIQIRKLFSADPFADTFKFEGFMDCGFHAFFITDNCDMAIRTAADGLNETVGNPGVPRGIQNNRNTAFYDIGGSASTVVFEAIWENPEVPEMMVELSSTPIDNLCDCSDTEYIRVTGESPTYGRLDEDAVPAGLTVAARGFLPFSGAGVAVNHQFTLFTTVFHNHIPEEGWSMVEGTPLPF